jgi:alkylated DNA repair dioxygenase AlkB
LPIERTFVYARFVLTWQPSLLGASSPGFDPLIPSARRRFLGRGAWVDWAPSWVQGADAVFEQVAAVAPWADHQRPMYDTIVDEPRLSTRRWPDPPLVLGRIAEALVARYGRDLRAISANLYRDGNDGVAWHGDKVRSPSDCLVAILSLGSPRRLLLRPTGGGGSVRYLLASGDLLVMGGTTQQTWQHSIPKCRAAGSRISVMYREVGQI